MPRHTLRSFLLLTIAGSLSPSLAQNLNMLKSAFRQGQDEALLRQLVAFRDTIPDNSNFELDYMIAFTLGKLPGFEQAACDYAKSISFFYHSPYLFDGRPVDMSGLVQNSCPQSRPQPGVMTIFRAQIPIKGAALKEVHDKLNSRIPKPSTTMAMDGVYNMVHDGWKGQLILNGPGGRYIGADGRAFNVRVVNANGNHLVFVIIGLGGQNADGLGGQKFDGYMMTQTHDAIAGVTWWQGQPFGFYAIRR